MKPAVVAILLGLLIGFASIQLIRIGASTSREERMNQKVADKYLGPTVDYDSDFQIARLGNQKEREIREARRLRYNKRAPEPLAQLPPNWEGFETGTDWYIGIPALPVGRSDAITVGEVVSSEAHLSTDKTGVYSEFSIRVDEVLKTHPNNPLNVGEITVGEREGGVVRFQDGRLFQYRVYNQGMPRVERKYLFFLSLNKEGEDFSIITAYEIGGGRVVPLDDSKSFRSVQGASEQELLNKVRSEITRSSGPPPRERTEVK